MTELFNRSLSLSLSLSLEWLDLCRKSAHIIRRAVPEEVGHGPDPADMYGRTICPTVVTKLYLSPIPQM